MNWEKIRTSPNPTVEWLIQSTVCNIIEAHAAAPPATAPPAQVTKAPAPTKAAAAPKKKSSSSDDGFQGESLFGGDDGW